MLIWMLTVSAYITLAPPPATIVQMRPFEFKTVNFKDALVCNIYISIMSTSNITVCKRPHVNI